MPGDEAVQVVVEEGDEDLASKDPQTFLSDELKMLEFHFFRVDNDPI